MKTPINISPAISGRISLLFLWLLGIPLPVLILIWFFRG
jgi:hypothetical protein